MKLILGTAQFGFDYGINNQRGQISKKEVFKILTYAWKNKIRFLDTATGYGDSVKIIGEYIKKNKSFFKIICRFPKCNPKRIRSFFLKSLVKLGQDQIYGYLIHDFKSFLADNDCWKVLEKLKAESKIKKIGFSLYYPKELDYLLENGIKFDILQIPYNVFDQRFASYFKRLKKKNVEIYARSVFLQGLVFKKPSRLTLQFKKIKPKIKFLNKLSKDLSIPIAGLCLNFIILNNDVNKIIVGIDSLNNLKENLKVLKYCHKIKDIYYNLLSLKERDENIILPPNWN